MLRLSAKLIETIWHVSMGMYLGLTAGMVMSVILIFKGARGIHARPGSAPYNNERFAEHHSEAVAGYIGQDLFELGGTIALLLLAAALTARLVAWLLCKFNPHHLTGSKRLDRLRGFMLIVCIALMMVGGELSETMNEKWPRLYDTQASDRELDLRRRVFDGFHSASETVVGFAWLIGLASLSLSPWCRRFADTPLQLVDGEEKVNPEEQTHEDNFTTTQAED